MRDFTHHQRIGVVVHSHIAKREPNPGCKTGGFYVKPTAGETVDVGAPLNVTWDATCLDIAKADVYLYAPGTEKSRIYLWEGVDFKTGSYAVQLKPKWWNSTESQTLQFAIVETGGSLFMNQYPAGPVFTAKYDKNAGTVAAADADTSTPDAGWTTIKTEEPKSLTSGKIAAGVLIPLLFIGLLAFAWVKYNRRRRHEKSKRYSQAMDKRMSTISTEWKSMSAAGASAAIRNSIAVSGGSGDRQSGFSFGAIRPQSSVTTLESGQAGVGARRLYNLDGENGSRMSQARVSRVSFADQPRPSMESRRAANGTSRAFHSAYIPPLPTRQDSSGSDEGAMSPTQTQGALPLTNADIDVLPALSMMRTDGGADMLLPAPNPPSPITPPTPAHHKSPVVGVMPIPTAAVMSPDEMLRAYAERRSTTPSSGISFPAPALGANGMRTLHSNTPTSSLARKSAAPTVGSTYSNDDEVPDDAYDAIAK